MRLNLKERIKLANIGWGSYKSIKEVTGLTYPTIKKAKEGANLMPDNYELIINFLKTIK
jgi:uncharacterized protein YerC